MFDDSISEMCTFYLARNPKMHLTKVTLKQGPKLFNLLKQKSGTDGYAAHQLLWDLFPNDGEKKRDFLFHKDDKNGRPSFLVVSKDRPAETDALTIQTKEYSPKLSEGQKLVFTLIANPVVARKTEGKKHSVKHDVWMDAKMQGQKNGLSETALFQACEEASKEWLIRQGERCGFHLSSESVLIDGYQQNRFYKGSRSKPVRFSSIHYEGLLSVTEPDKFIEMLGKGLGKSKAFGCGLMLIKPA